MLRFLSTPSGISPFDVCTLIASACRYVGGLVSAFELSGDSALLDKAREIGDRLLKAFEGAASGLPHPIVNLRTGATKTPGWNRGKMSLSEIGSCQLEFASLSHHTGRRCRHPILLPEVL